MKRKNCFYIVLLLQVLFVAACYEEKELSPSGIVTSYSVPQGDHDYDDVIVDYYKKYGSCLLYKFTDKDAYWTPSGWKDGAIGEGGKGGFIVSPADENYVGKQLDMIRKLWFDTYSDEFLTEFLPVKILLCSQIDSVSMTWDFSDWSNIKQVGTGKKVGAWYNYDNICVAYGSEAVNGMTKADSLLFREKINTIFVESMVGRGKTVPTQEFATSANYNMSSSDAGKTSKLWAAGIIRQMNYSTISVENDWRDFMLMMVLFSEEFLTRSPLFTNEYNMTSANWDGILNRVKDVNGLLKKRYDLVRNYFIENYNMDLQKVGNALNR